ncbi:hypothetical protein CO2235_MP130156 [Cupriavidus oxalaticus]|uniref:Uncharacterized protein n=1 Tax=Cupriavidus oxalaticus TaxID=96344 RepID=A0A976BH01_9BURK|nr:hypothetical protein CO2235_MP130156 [Cupriavidus oxalaticus]
MAILVHLPSFMAVPITALLREQAPDITVWNGREAAVPEEVEAIIAWGLKPGVLPAYPKLRLVCAATAGVDKLLAAPDLPQDMPVTRIVDPGQQTGIAHFVLAMALRHTRELGVYAEQRHRGEWKRHRGRALSRCRVGAPPPPASTSCWPRRTCRRTCRSRASSIPASRPASPTSCWPWHCAIPVNWVCMPSSGTAANGSATAGARCRAVAWACWGWARSAARWPACSRPSASRWQAGAAAPSTCPAWRTSPATTGWMRCWRRPISWSARCR